MTSSSYFGEEHDEGETVGEKGDADKVGAACRGRR
jgi:hypothetical protein